MNELLEHRLRMIDAHIEYITHVYGDGNGEMARVRDEILRALHKRRDELLMQNGRRRAKN